MTFEYMCVGIYTITLKVLDNNIVGIMFFFFFYYEMLITYSP